MNSVSYSQGHEDYVRSFHLEAEAETEVDL